MSSFRNSKVIFATNHGKVAAALEPFRQELGASVEALAIDSDSLGTFSGEVARAGSMLDALRGKIAMARQVTTERLVLASEGSFSAAGGLGLLAQGVEMLMLHDSTTGAEVVEQHISLETNYATASLRTVAELEPFLRRIRFGSHALVLYPEGLPLTGNVHKGISAQSDAARIFLECLERSPTKSVMAMSDMRAHLNPTRMREISLCCGLLARRLATECPKCRSGGFGLVSTVSGLPCEWCGSPTRRARAEIHACVVCGKRLERPRSDGNAVADPSECERCNP